MNIVNYFEEVMEKGKIETLIFFYYMQIPPMTLLRH